MGRFAGTASYVLGQPVNESLGYLALSIDELAEKQVPHCFVLQWAQGKFSELEKEGWLPAGLATTGVDGDVVVVGNFGMTLEVTNAGVTRGAQVDSRLPPDQKIRTRGPLRCVRRIGTHVYAVGGDRQAFRRIGAGDWNSFGNSARPDPADTTVYGFESVDGFGEDDIYAVGWKGEIWRFNGTSWTRLPSPTNLLLTAVCCAGDGNVYAGGTGGLLLRGRGDRWDVVDTQGVKADFWSIVWFKDMLYLSGMQDLFLLRDGEIEYVDPGLGPSTFNLLVVENHILWSIGATDVLAFDGRNWERID